MNVQVLRLAGFFGMLAPIFGFAMIALSILFSPWFSFTSNALSDLGAAGLGSVIFNSGLAMTGAIYMMFCTGLFEMAGKDLTGMVGAALNFAASLFLVGIAVANINVEPYHLYVSVGFFVAMPLAAAVVALFNYRNHMRPYALLGWGTAVLAAAVWLLPWSSAALPESLASLFFGVWQFLLARWMYTRPDEKLG